MAILTILCIITCFNNQYYFFYLGINALQLIFSQKLFSQRFTLNELTALRALEPSFTAYIPNYFKNVISGGTQSEAWESLKKEGGDAMFLRNAGPQI